MSILDRFKSKREQDVTDKAGSGSAGQAAKATSKPKQDKKPAAAKAAKPKTADKATVKAGTLRPDLLHILVKPLVTEKSAILAAHQQYAFRVAMDANRVQVKQAVKALYGVNPKSVNIQRVRGKFVRFGKMSGQRQTWKKAIVTLPAGTSIDVYAGM